MPALIIFCDSSYTRKYFYQQSSERKVPKKLDKRKIHEKVRKFKYSKSKPYRGRRSKSSTNLQIDEQTTTSDSISIHNAKRLSSGTSLHYQYSSLSNDI